MVHTTGYSQIDPTADNPDDDLPCGWRHWHASARCWGIGLGSYRFRNEAAEQRSRGRYPARDVRHFRSAPSRMQHQLAKLKKARSPRLRKRTDDAPRDGEAAARLERGLCALDQVAL